VVTEPHSFDVAVRAVYGGATHEWAYQSYEGRTTIGAAQAEAAGIRVEAAGPATLEETIALSGRVELQPQGTGRDHRLVSRPHRGHEPRHRRARP
jgi:cobalt-zinc-cadmium efflux system membrane fusion protein